MPFIFPDSFLKFFNNDIKLILYWYFLSERFNNDDLSMRQKEVNKQENNN